MREVVTIAKASRMKTGCGFSPFGRARTLSAGD
jgi:hypothetical protein